MKFIYSILALAAALTVSNGQCVFDTCVKEGERCDTAYFNFTNPSNAQVNCEYGTFCPVVTSFPGKAPTCTRLLGYGETCNAANPFTKCAEPYSCISKGGISTCNIKAYLGYGEDCTTSLQCTGYNEADTKDFTATFCYEGKCQRLPEQNCGQNLQDGHEQCPYGQWCDTSLIAKNNGRYTPDACTNWVATGATCDRDAQCAYNEFCDTADTNTCQPQFTKTAGANCTGSSGIPEPFSPQRYECNIGLTCQFNGVRSVCAEISAVPTGSCTNGGVNCGSDSYCQCSTVDNLNEGTCSPTYYSLSTSCKTQLGSIASCAMEHECQVDLDSLGPDSCIFKHCSSQMCDTSCSQENTKATCGEYVANNICKIPSSSSIVLPSFVILIIALIALLF